MFVGKLGGYRNNDPNVEHSDRAMFSLSLSFPPSAVPPHDAALHDVRPSAWIKKLWDCLISRTTIFYLIAQSVDRHTRAHYR